VSLLNCFALYKKRKEVHGELSMVGRMKKKILLLLLLVLILY
jgi:hypothetical protein